MPGFSFGRSGLVALAALVVSLPAAGAVQLAPSVLAFEKCSKLVQAEVAAKVAQAQQKHDVQRVKRLAQKQDEMLQMLCPLMWDSPLTAATVAPELVGQTADQKKVRALQTRLEAIAAKISAGSKEPGLHSELHDAFVTLRELEARPIMADTETKR